MPGAGAGAPTACWECGGTGATSRPQGLEGPEPPAASEGWGRPLPTDTFSLQGAGAGVRGAVRGIVEPSQRGALGSGMPLEFPGPEEWGSSGAGRKEEGDRPGGDSRGSGGGSVEAPHPVRLDPLGFF